MTGIFFLIIYVAIFVGQRLCCDANWQRGIARLHLS